MKPPQKAIILAAGLGTRMHPLSLDTPKPLMPVWGKPIIGHLLNTLVRWGVKEVLLNLHFNPSAICDRVKKEKPGGLRVSFSFEPEILGTGGVLRRAGWFLDTEPFWMINSDIAVDLTPFRLLAEFKRPKTIAALWMEPERGPRTVEMRRGNIVNFQTSRPGTMGTYTFGGLQLISPDLLRYLPRDNFCSIVQIYQNAIRVGRIIRGVCIPGAYWADLGTPESYLKAHAEIRERYFQGLSGQKLFNPGQNQRTTELRKKGVRVTGFASIDKSAVVQPGARIENAVIWSKAVIGPDAIVQDAIVGSGCEINGRVPRLAVKPSFNGHADIQLNLALSFLRLDPARTAIMPFESRGSARSFTRLASGHGKSYIMVRYSRERHENCLYVRHAEFLKGLGLNVPAVIADFPKQQFTLFQDLGDVSLQRIARNCSRPELAKYYRRVLKAVLLLHRQGAACARKERLEMVAPFSPDLYLWEREFFARHFLILRLNLKPPMIKCIMGELAAIGRRLDGQPQVLIHRDLQSSNILFYKNCPYFIDFQGMRLGPAAYDLASLLCDPYAGLALSEQGALLGYYNRLAGKGAQISAAIFWMAAVQRLSQALGAYGRLADNAETKWFAQYIPPAVQMMRRALEQTGICPRLYEVITKSDLNQKVAHSV